MFSTLKCVYYVFIIKNEMLNAKENAVKTHCSIVVRFAALSVFACKHKTSSIKHISMLDKRNLKTSGYAAHTRLNVPYSALSRWVSRPDRVV